MATRAGGGGGEGPSPALLTRDESREKRDTMLIIDGSTGEGGGQILRTSLALSLITGSPVKVCSIRARRSRPGLMRQHLTAVRAAAEVGRAEVSGDAIGSREIVFRPQEKVKAGRYTFNVGSAGSTTLVLQTVLPALMSAEGASHVTLEGGTHNRMAPPFDFLDKAFLPLLARMGPRVTAELVTPGFYPAGGGHIEVRIEPAKLVRLDLPERGEIRSRRALAAVANLPIAIARREMETAREVLGWEVGCFQVAHLKGSVGPGNVMTITVACDHVTEVFSGFGEKGVRAEVVAEEAAREAKAWLDSGAPVGEHLADQLLLPMALAGGGSFRTMTPSLHTKTQMELLDRVLGTRTTVAEVSAGVFEIEVRGAR
ncbi:RNA 3'-terminal phosphate cyclase [Minicystis rosea]|nr:RNA 3'-terminal phosphate cyclase [Minicystis rosea]